MICFIHDDQIGVVWFLDHGMSRASLGSDGKGPVGAADLDQVPLAEPLAGARDPDAAEFVVAGRACCPDSAPSSTSVAEVSLVLHTTMAGVPPLTVLRFGPSEVR